ncbi:hypothetical protein [Flammeovirga sp. SJP92]|uniref:hypothetical protein n=1 Tax=Flammeovirga sp. SJP92 TaxID=1775430 RepID=UPI0007878D44|nr:hypothetical protein [Flammeovirga sp. SJP92]KXX66615.1 hypothetical protein AVL50_31460 [Flammeovirga sp. SJP92]
MIIRCILSVLFFIHTFNADAQSDHAEATGYLDYFVATYNTYEVAEDDSILFIKDGAYISKEEVYLNYQVEVNPQDDFNKQEEFYRFLIQTVQHPLEEEAFELQIYAVDYHLTIRYLFEDDSYLLIKKNAHLEQEAIYFNKDKKMVKKL